MSGEFGGAPHHRQKQAYFGGGSDVSYKLQKSLVVLDCQNWFGPTLTIVTPPVVIMFLFFVLLTVVFGPIENLVVCATAGVRNNHSCSRIGNRPAGVGHRGLPATCRDLHLLVSRSGECESGMISCSPLLL